jgi:hypothetical protein
VSIYSVKNFPGASPRTPIPRGREGGKKKGEEWREGEGREGGKRKKGRGASTNQILRLQHWMDDELRN